MCALSETQIGGGDGGAEKGKPLGRGRGGLWERRGQRVRRENGAREACLGVEMREKQDHFRSQISLQMHFLTDALSAKV